MPGAKSNVGFDFNNWPDPPPEAEDWVPNPAMVPSPSTYKDYRSEKVSWKEDQAERRAEYLVKDESVIPPVVEDKPVPAVEGLGHEEKKLADISMEPCKKYDPEEALNIQKQLIALSKQMLDLGNAKKELKGFISDALNDSGRQMTQEQSYKRWVQVSMLVSVSRDMGTTDGPTKTKLFVMDQKQFDGYYQQTMLVHHKFWNEVYADATLRNFQKDWSASKGPERQPSKPKTTPKEDAYFQLSDDDLFPEEEEEDSSRDSDNALDEGIARSDDGNN
ncbi:hypothetical protein BS50DRAFT_674378 [Corynespora cassiicola Philippines]|uniref:Uncharacterized protein n=1 Tax=Corynespora cassiicola Philippines TaxID=1448308 RepID=A0A2T2NWR6_CORCC|nr:hypothetical protein BS50DRAFT_674378 [Corynespora cassiicola Philippines]